MKKHPQLWWQSRINRLGLFIGFWTLLGLINVGQSYFAHLSRGAPFDFSSALLLGVSDWYVWAALTPLIIWLGRRFRLDRRPLLLNLFVHVVMTLLCVMTVVVLAVPVYMVLYPPTELPLVVQRTFWGLVRGYLQGYLVFYSWVYWAILGVGYALEYHGRFRDRERDAAQLAAQLVQAQLQVLKMQLHPHFLFNTLNTISALVHQDVDVADRMIARLGELLRTTLQNAGTNEVSLRQELEFIEPYLEIEQARLGDRLAISMDVDPDTMDAYVPNLLLQPLVENAIRHGIAPTTAQARIEIRARRANGELRLAVSDNGIGMRDVPESSRQGVGLANTRARLCQLYGHRQHLKLAETPGGGVTVDLVLPFHEAADGRTDAKDGPAASAAREWLTTAAANNQKAQDFGPASEHP
jgi:two-component system LytT family sensor kinase